jgi:hypothetical protein
MYFPVIQGLQNRFTSSCSVMNERGKRIVSMHVGKGRPVHSVPTRRIMTAVAFSTWHLVRIFKMDTVVAQPV